MPAHRQAPPPGLAPPAPPAHIHLQGHCNPQLPLGPYHPAALRQASPPYLPHQLHAQPQVLHAQYLPQPQVLHAEYPPQPYMLHAPAAPHQHHNQPSAAMVERSNEIALALERLDMAGELIEDILQARWVDEMVGVSVEQQRDAQLRELKEALRGEVEHLTGLLRENGVIR